MVCVKLTFFDLMLLAILIGVCQPVRIKGSHVDNTAFYLSILILISGALKVSPNLDLPCLTRSQQLMCACGMPVVGVAWLIGLSRDHGAAIADFSLQVVESLYLLL